MKRFVYYKRFQPIFNQSDEMGGRVMVDGEGRWDREKEGGSAGCGGGGGGKGGEIEKILQTVIRDGQQHPD